MKRFLNRSQVKGVLEEIANHGLEPTSFIWLEQPSRFLPGLIVSALVHKASEYFYQFDFDKFAFHKAVCSPGEDNSIGFNNPGSWKYQLIRVSEWLNRVVSELNALPDGFSVLSTNDQAIQSSKDASIGSIPEISRSIEIFRRDYPESTKTAFIMMRFGSTPVHEAIVNAIKGTLDQNGISGLRADDKQYHDDLFPNVLTYMYGCDFGIAVFERIEIDEFNPNVALEVGYMLALGKPICLLKDRNLVTLHADLIGRLYKAFDPFDPGSTIPNELATWLKDKEIIG